MAYSMGVGGMLYLLVRVFVLLWGKNGASECILVGFCECIPFEFIGQTTLKFFL